MAAEARLPEARAAARFYQIAALEREVIAQLRLIADCRAHLKELTAGYEGLIEAVRKAARDEGELPYMPLLALFEHEPAREPDGGAICQ